MRVVLDTNVIVSSLISRGPPHQIIDAWYEQRLTVLISIALLAEYSRSIRYAKVRHAHGLDEEAIERFIHQFIYFGELVVPNTQLTIVTNDPDDDRILECAVAGFATQIVTGDRHLLALGSYEEIPILTPRAFIDLLDVNDDQ